MVTKKNAKTKPSAFAEIASGLADAISIARADADPKTFRAHIPERVDVAAIRKQAGLSQERFAAVFGFSPGAVRDWEQHRSVPDRSTRAYLKVIEKEPKAAIAALTA